MLLCLSVAICERHASGPLCLHKGSNQGSYELKPEYKKASEEPMPEKIKVLLMNDCRKELSVILSSFPWTTLLMPSLSDGIDMNAGGKAVKEIIGIFSF